MWAVISHGCVDENDVKSTCDGTRLEFKIKQDEKFLIQNLTRRKVLI